LAGYYVVPSRFKNLFLLLASLFFYAWGEPKFVFVMMGSILANWFFGILVEALKRQGRIAATRASMVLMLAFNIGLFFVFKYLTFSLNQINHFFGLALEGPNFLLPIGISFFTFQAISYVIDVYRGNAEVQKNPLNTALYIALFPQLIAGPIVRYQTIATEINVRSFKLEDFSRGIRRFIMGLAKKVIVANQMAAVADLAFTGFDPSATTVLMVWLGLVCYTLQIYFDFSGYSDMAIGLGLMFGFHFNENFNHPYVSRSVTEFWRRWHISLGTWFRDYVYFPLGGSRVKSKARLVLNLFIVWSLTGIWHGASWNFLFWGLFYFVLLTGEKLTGITQRLEGHRILRQLYRAATLLFVMIGWVFFRSEGMGKSLEYLGSLFGLIPTPLFDSDALYFLSQNAVVLIIAIIGATPLVINLCRRIAARAGIDPLSLAPLVSQAAGEEALAAAQPRPTALGYAVSVAAFVLSIGLLLVSMASLVSATFNPFIYFNF
jgi:alginate O-acetyltransferase complex protein AlgI